MEDSNAFITRFGYLSIDKEWFDNTRQKTIVVNGRVYNIDRLRHVITYSDSRDWYRWARTDYKKADVT